MHPPPPCPSQGRVCSTDPLLTCQCSGGGAPPTQEPPGGGGGGGGGGGPTPTPVPTEPPGGPTPEPPGPTPTPGPAPSEYDYCLTCYPWAYCASGLATVCFHVDENEEEVWVTYQSCLEDPSVCEKQSPPPPDRPEPPCTPEPGGDGISFNCPGDEERGFDWGYYLWVSARVPPHRVKMWPFPRWLVAMGAPLPQPFESGEPGRLTLLDDPAFTPPELCAPHGPGNEGGCWSDAVSFPTREEGEEPQPGDVRNYRIGLRWRRARNDRPHPNDIAGVPPVCWDFDEREWNIGKDYGYGRIVNEVCWANEVTHIYETSSWGKPHNGARFLPPEEVCRRVDWERGCCEQVPDEWDLPAYQVRVYTTWAAEWAVEYERYERVGTEWSECQCTDYDPAQYPDVEWRSCGDPPEGVCVGVYDDPQTEWWGKQREVVYDWVHHFEGWYPIDLREYGNPTWYYTSYRVTTIGEGPWCPDHRYTHTGDAVPVPVIEVQSVLRDPCVIDNSCPPGYPGPGNLERP
ncbi:MAG TPA: hypothetical protein ENK08_07260 [Chloroflexi bacterium]|nr:hypothetical protein [Chloroflexota bacterium]